MPCVRCRVLAPGRYRDGTRLTPVRVRQLVAQTRTMLANGLHVPVWKTFADNVQLSDSERLARLSRHNVGFVEGLSVDRAGVIWASVDAPDPDDARRLRDAPHLAVELARDYTDGSGRKWPGLSLSRLALTMEGPPTRLSLDAGPRVVRLSLADRLTEESTMFDKVLAALASYGISLPDDTSEENFLDRLYVALTALGGSKGGGDDEDLGADTDDGSEAYAPPVPMSMDRRRGRGAPVDPREAEARKRDVQEMYRNAKAERTAKLWDQAMGRGPNRGA